MIVEAGQNRILLRSWDSIAFEARIQMRIAKGKLDLSGVQEDHWNIVRALDKGNAVLAGRLSRKHGTLFLEELRGQMGYTPRYTSEVNSSGDTNPLPHFSSNGAVGLRAIASFAEAPACFSVAILPRTSTSICSNATRSLRPPAGP